MKKRYLVQTAAANLGLVMRKAFGCGTPREMANRARDVIVLFFFIALALWRWVVEQVGARKLGHDSRMPFTRVTQNACFSTGC